jgi:predicted Zn-ribbon and HTH transcriptional regulator
MPTHEEHILRILGEATEPLFPSEIAERLNRELGPAGAYTSLEIVARLKRMSDQVVQTPDGRWMLKRLMP